MNGRKNKNSSIDNVTNPIFVSEQRNQTIIEKVTHGSLRKKGGLYYSVNVSERSGN